MAFTLVLLPIIVVLAGAAAMELATKYGREATEVVASWLLGSALFVLGTVLLRFAIDRHHEVDVAVLTGLVAAAAYEHVQLIVQWWTARADANAAERDS